MHFDDPFRHFHTYLVSLPQVKESNYMYGNPLNKFTWTIDRCTIVEPVETVNPPEEPLPPPTRLNLTPFGNFEYQTEGSEFDVLAIVLNTSPSTYASNGQRIQDFIIMDDQAQQNEQMLIAYTMKSTSPTCSLLFVPLEEGANCRNPTAKSRSNILHTC
uniref:Uncharacterized protein LOC104224828 n=1 Tax=Nicotiana sylvestris TaxID=4096 RepID=A0A1U7W470_NICSY|nr:PREDICTED: uncharacterized protein LOC104224828 [Nicotiana sylvestris]XP_009774837.1 PREDICTED: uncharacterized protein LOC104224828 [Nicotiana sylvestris]